MVLNNRDLAYVTWEERVQLGDPKWEASQALPDVPYAEFAKLIGLGGRRVEDPEEVGPAWNEALSADRPFVLDMVTDPNVPPLPPHITLKQARTFAGALLAGEPELGSALANTAREVIGGDPAGRGQERVSGDGKVAGLATETQTSTDYARGLCRSLAAP